MERHKILPFQVTIPSSDYELYHVQDGVETDITSYMNGVTYDGGNLIHDDTNLNNVLPDGRCYLKLVNASDYTLYTDDIDIGCIFDWLKSWTVNSGTVTRSGKDITSMVGTSSAHSNSFDVDKGDLLELVFEKTSGGDPYVYLMDSGDNLIVNLSKASTGEVFRYYGTVTKSLTDAYIRVGVVGITVAMNTFEIRKNYSRNLIKYTISSSVDYGGLKYDSASWSQYVWKSANVRRSPSVEVTQIGEEKNGQFIPEKRTSAVRYSVKMKATEQEFEAFVHSISGNVTIIDQTGYSFVTNKKEISDPSWYYSNGIIEITFVDEGNVNVYTLNNTAL